jgi:hypothetical protein
MGQAVSSVKHLCWPCFRCINCVNNGRVDLARVASLFVKMTLCDLNYGISELFCTVPQLITILFC